MTRTAITLFSGFGLADIGLQAAGYTVIRAVEYDAAIAGVYRQNHGDHILTADVRDLSFDSWQADHLHASPPCPNFSVAKSGGVETPEDTAMAEAVCRALRAIRPRTFTLENVRGYAGSQSLQRIGATLMELDYCVEQYVINAADVGVPQTRERLFLRARAGGFMQSLPPLPPKQAWRGWYSAIEDLLPTLPESQFAAWQLARLPEHISGSLIAHPNADNNRFPARTENEPIFTVATFQAGMPRAFIISNAATEYSEGIRDGAAPSFSVTTQTAGRARAWLVDTANTSRAATLLPECDPSMTVQAWHGRRPSHAPLAWLSQGRVVSMTPRALARFMGCPDSYQLPAKQGLACKGLGNGVCPPVMTALMEGL